jgi:phage anti-repressor protein
MELIKIQENDKGQRVVSAKELYLILGYDKSNWSSWYKKNIVENDFAIENEDWIGFVLTTNGNETKV